eukprot:Skav230005  [mRNA]  locus=scaffold5058:3896:10669:+ [translate_table: standard]
MRESNQAAQERKTGFGEASKVVKCPTEFGSASSSEDAGKWIDFSFAFKQWLFYADPDFEADIAHVEANAGTAVVFQQTPVGEASKKRSKKLYAILSGVLQNRPLRILRQVPENNGLETWRQLFELYSPRTKTRSLAILSAIMSHPQFTGARTILEQIQGLERMSDEYRKASGVDVNDDLLLTTLVRCLPRQLQQHVQLTMDENATFRQIKEKAVAYERLSSTWSKDKIYAELGAVTSYATDGGGPAAMEINQLKGKDKGKSKGKYDKGKAKGKGKDQKGGKGKGDHGKGKGYGSAGGKSGGKPGGKQPGKKPETNQCSYCYGYGHWKKDCRKFQADKASGQVRQVDQESDASSTTASAATTKTAGKIQRLEAVFEDLTAFNDAPVDEETLNITYLRVVTQVDDLTPLSHSPHDGVCHLRALEVDMDRNLEDIILDSGADTSALPLRFAGVGKQCHAGKETFVDAQGNALHIHPTRVANITLSNQAGENEIVFKERFILTNVGTPLVALGHILRAGWELKHRDGGLRLVKDEKEVEVLYRRNSLCVRGCIAMIANFDAGPHSPNAPNSEPHKVPKMEPPNAPKTEAPNDPKTEACFKNAESEEPSVRVIELMRSLRTLAPGWNRINPHLYAIKTTEPKFVDSTLAPADELMWLRTTLVFRGGAYEVAEYCEPISELEDLEAEMFSPESVVEVITLAHVHALPAEDLGFSWPTAEIPGAVELSNDDDDYEASIAADDAEHNHEGAVPVDEKEGEPVVEDRIIPYEEEDAVYIDGVKFTIDDTLRTLRAGCENLGISTRGSKAQCLKRMIEHVRKQTFLAAHEAVVKVGSTLQRQPVGQRKPDEPTDEEKRNHELVHEPFREWCELCVAHRAKQDPHRPRGQDDVKPGHSVLSFDFGYASRDPEEKDKQCFLSCHDSDTRLVMAIPTPQKGGKYLRYLTTELVRFICYTGHKELGLRHDSEPSCLALADSVRKASRGLGILVHSEPTPVGDHQANGGAEVMVHVLRSKANLLVNQVENSIGAQSKTIFGCHHPVYAWALVHASWLHNHFVVKEQVTAFEASFGRFYSGKLACYGEPVMGFLKTTQKGSAKWRKAIWLSKTLTNDVHILGTGDGIFVTRSIRRLPGGGDAEMLSNLVASPWDFGYASLGHRLLHAKRAQGPLAVGVGDVLIHDPEAEAVQKYARENPNEDKDIPEGEETKEAKPVDAQKDVAGAVSGALAFGLLAPQTPMEEEPARSGIKHAGDELEDKPAAKRAGGVEASAFGVVMPETPDTAMLDDLPTEESPEKIGKLNLIEMHSMDEEVDPIPDLHDGERDALFEHELGTYEEELEMTPADMVRELIFPWTKDEPQLDNDTMGALDALADAVEMKRLLELGVLKDNVDELPVDTKELSTKFVRTWREKRHETGEPIWLRRSRLVAREYVSLDVGREGLFSPASSSITNRMLPLQFLRRRDTEDMVMCSIDIKDAFLTVDQRTSTRVTCRDALGRAVDYSLGKVLPGQRDGSLLWWEDLTKELNKSPLQFNECKACPSLLRSADGSTLILVHVDDLLVVGRRRDVTQVLLPYLKLKYQVSVEMMSQADDEVTFLKKQHVLMQDGRMVIKPHSKHVTQICKLLGLNPKLQCKKSPSHSDIQNVDVSTELPSEKATVFRTCVGVLMYLAADLPHCQCVIRYLSSRMSRPTEKSLVVLRHLAGYLACHEGVVPSLKWKGKDHGVLVHLEEGVLVIEIFSDADWAADKEERRSISGCAVFIGGNLIHFSSKTQKVVSLSSAESETYAAAGATMDGVFLKGVMEFISGEPADLRLYLDSAAARGVLSRKGVGRIRHLSCRCLWIQELVKAGILKVKPVSGALNPADVGTKRLSAGRLRSLMYLLGLFDLDEGHLEGHNDPGGLFRQRTGLQTEAALRAIIGALGLGLTLQGCDRAENGEVETSEAPKPLALFVTIMVIAIGILASWRWNGGVEEEQGNPLPYVPEDPIARMTQQERDEWRRAEELFLFGPDVDDRPDDPMEEEPEELQGIWASEAVPVEDRNPPSGSDRVASLAPTAATLLYFNEPQTHSERQELCRRFVESDERRQRERMENIPVLAEFRRQAFYNSINIFPDFVVQEEDSQDNDEDMDVDEDEAEIETNYGSLVMAMEAEEDYMEMDNAEYADYREQMLVRSTGVEEYLRNRISDVQAEFDDTTDRHTRWVMQTDLRELLQIQDDVRSGGPSDRREAIRYLLESYRADWHGIAEMPSGQRADQWGWRGMRNVFELQAEDLV